MKVAVQPMKCNHIVAPTCHGDYRVAMDAPLSVEREIEIAKSNSAPGRARRTHRDHSAPSITRVVERDVAVDLHQPRRAIELHPPA